MKYSAGWYSVRYREGVPIQCQVQGGYLSSARSRGGTCPVPGPGVGGCGYGAGGICPVPGLGEYLSSTRSGGCTLTYIPPTTHNPHLPKNISDKFLDFFFAQIFLGPKILGGGKRNFFWTPEADLTWRQTSEADPEAGAWAAHLLRSRRRTFLLHCVFGCSTIYSGFS